MNFTSVIAVALGITLITQPSHAWNPIKEIVKVVENVADAAHDVATLGEHGRDRDRERAEAEQKQAQIRAEEAEKARVAKAQSLREQRARARAHHSDLAQLVPRIQNVVTAQADIEATVLSIITEQESGATKTKGTQTQVKLTANQIAEIMAALKVIFINREAEQDGNKELESFEIGMSMLVEIAKENNLVVQDMIHQALKHQAKVGKSLAALAKASSERLLEAKAMLEELQARAETLDQQIKELTAQLAEVDPAGELAELPRGCSFRGVVSQGDCVRIPKFPFKKLFR